MIQLYHQIFIKLGKKTVNEKIKPIENKIEQNKVQDDLDRQIGKVFALMLVNMIC